MSVQRTMDQLSAEKERELEDLRAKHEAVLIERESSGDELAIRLREVDTAREEETRKRKEAEEGKKEVQIPT